MKFMYIAAVVATLASASVLTGCEKKEPTLGEKIDAVAKDASKAADKAAKDADKAAKDAAKAVEDATK